MVASHVRMNDVKDIVWIGHVVMCHMFCPTSQAAVQSIKACQHSSSDDTECQCLN